MAVVTAEEVWLAMGKTLPVPDDVRERLESSIDETQSDLENYLNRVIERRQITDSYELSASKYLYLRGPLITIRSVRPDTEAPGTDVDWQLPGHSYIHDALYIPSGEPGMVYRVTYVAGDFQVNTEARALIKRVAIRNSIVGVSISSGALRGLSVEGASASFGDSFSDPNAVGAFSPTELTTVRRLRRIVTR